MITNSTVLNEKGTLNGRGVTQHVHINTYLNGFPSGETIRMQRASSSTNCTSVYNSELMCYVSVNDISAYLTNA